MNLRQIYNEVLNEHNLRPAHYGIMESPDLVLEGVNPNCGDDYTLQLKIENGVITDGMFTGDGCAVSKASIDIMMDLMIGREKEEALKLSNLFGRMIKGEAGGEELEALEDAAMLEGVSRMPARVKCAVLGWRTFEEMMSGKLP